jgi:hypothetical protein
MWLALLSVGEVPSSDLGLEMDNLFWPFSWISSLRPCKCWDIVIKWMKKISLNILSDVI